MPLQASSSSPLDMRRSPLDLILGTESCPLLACPILRADRGTDNITRLTKEASQMQGTSPKAMRERWLRTTRNESSMNGETGEKKEVRQSRGQHKPNCHRPAVSLQQKQESKTKNSPHQLTPEKMTGKGDKENHSPTFHFPGNLCSLALASSSPI